MSETGVPEPSSEPEVAPAEGDPGSEPGAPGPVLSGDAVSPGLVLGTVHRKDYDLSKVRSQRVAQDEVGRELNRLRRGLEDSRAQLVDLKARLEGRVDAEDARILDTHVAYLKDSVFIADVENLILNEQMRLEAAITKVIGDFDRIFRLVANETLRQSAVDLRDVAIRVLRNLERAEGEAEGDAPPEEYVLVARELSIVDMFNLANEHVQGIATEGGGLTSHAAVFARSMGIPTIANVAGLLDAVEEGDFVILDATEGVVRVNPGELIRRQYESADENAEEAPVQEVALPPVTHDGVELTVRAACGNLPEVEQAAGLGVDAVGLYRTELLFLVERRPPSRDALVKHYRSVLDASNGDVVFRLLNVDSSLGVPYLHATGVETNPKLGRCGVRALLANESILRRQLQAVLVAAEGRTARIAVPMVNDCGELRRVKEILFEERVELRKAGREAAKAELGCVVETPLALLGIRDLVREADFLTLHLDSLIQHLLVADRESAALAEWFASLHPVALRALRKAVEVTREARCELSAFGLTVLDPETLRLLVGVGLREFCVPPPALAEFLSDVRTVDVDAAERAARTAEKSSCQAETSSMLEGFRHGWARS